MKRLYGKLCAILVSCAMVLGQTGVTLAAEPANAGGTTPPRMTQKVVRPDVSALEQLVDLPAPLGKLSTDLAQLAAPESVKVADKASLRKAMLANDRLVVGKVDGVKTDLVNVYVQYDSASDWAQIEPYLAKVDNRDSGNRLAAVQVAVSNLSALAGMDGVKSVRSILPPVVYAGSVNSKGDAWMDADDARAAFGVNGSGVKVGVISDGVDSLADAKASRDLPSNVTVLSNTQGGDEGTAMLEIVYDLAPGAQLYFHDCGDNTLAFNAAIDDLVKAGCTVIVDDIGWLLEPYYEDGVIAKHVADLVKANKIVYASSAGNAGYTHYQGDFYHWVNSSGQTTQFSDFSEGATDDNGYDDMYYLLAPGTAFVSVLQWDNAFGASGDDYALYLIDASTGNPLYVSDMVQDGNDDPLEYIQYVNNTGSPQMISVFVEQVKASRDNNIELYNYVMGSGSSYIDNAVRADSIFGHPAVNGVLACAAATDAGNGLEMEAFSSEGKVTMLNGTRQKPDVTGADGVQVTGAGGFGAYDSNTGKYYFYGTSAAAPHVAAVAALMRSKFPTMTANKVVQAIRTYAVDVPLGYLTTDQLLTGPVALPKGFDTQSGYGMANAFRTLGLGQYVKVVASANNNSYGTVSGYGYPKKGTTVTLTATPKAGYRFVRWLRGSTAVSTSTKYTFTAWADVAYKAEFAATIPVVKAASASYTSVKISWNKIPGAKGYQVYRSTSKAGTYKKVADTTSTSYTNKSLTTGKTYYYKVRMYTSSKTYSFSSIVSAKPVPATPTGVKAARVSNSSIKVSWSKVSGTTKYQIYRSASKTGTYKKVAETSNLSYTNKSLIDNKTYYYKVRAYRKMSSGKVYGAYSTIVSAKP